MSRIVDGLVNVDFGDRAHPEWMRRVKEAYEIDLPQDVREAWLWGNAEDFFGWPS